MSRQVTVGGDRLGGGKKMKVELHGFERSTHNLSEILRTTAAPGTLIPVFHKVVLPGDTFDIEMAMKAMTMPTIGPLLGSYIMEQHAFYAPLRLYQRQMMLNLSKTGLNMTDVLLPQMRIDAYSWAQRLKPLDEQQISKSCILNYLGVGGVGFSTGSVGSGDPYVVRDFNATKLLMYWDIYKQFYANQQEEIGVVIHKDVTTDAPVVTTATMDTGRDGYGFALAAYSPGLTGDAGNLAPSASIQIACTTLSPNFKPSQFILWIRTDLLDPTAVAEPFTLDQVFENIDLKLTAPMRIYGTNPTPQFVDKSVWYDGYTLSNAGEVDKNSPPELVTFPLSQIDDMKETLLSYNEVIIDASTPAPYGLLFERNSPDPGDEYLTAFSKQFSQEGLGIVPYKSDIYNNWMNKTWIDGPDGITEMTKVLVTDNAFTIDELNIKYKLNQVLNRIAISDGSVDAWQEANWDHARPKMVYSPVYLGGIMQDIIFDEVISQSASEGQPLGTLAGRGVTRMERKGGHVIHKVDEIGYIMILLSIRPNIDYSQGNDWDMNLKNADEFHKPGLDQIGFQDLLTDEIAWWDTKVDMSGGLPYGEPVYKTMGKQPAWINYMTSTNKVKGNFAVQTNQMFMVLSRNYSPEYAPTTGEVTIKDVTTYIDPTKFNWVFADVNLDAQNFWIQTGFKVEARRKMSYKVMPNL